MRLRVLLLAALVAVAALGAGLATPARADSSGSAPAFNTTKTVLREHLVNNVEQVVDSRTISLSVSQTANLRGRQEIQVSWSGAHPTGGIVADPNSIDAQQEEYPVVLLECRGTESPPAGGTPATGPRLPTTTNCRPPCRTPQLGQAREHAGDRARMPLEQSQCFEVGREHGEQNGCADRLARLSVPYAHACGRLGTARLQGYACASAATALV